MKDLIKTSALGAMLLLHSLISCSQVANQNLKNNDQKSHFNVQAIKLNDSASQMQLKIIGLELPHDSVKSVENLFKQAIQIEPKYKTAYLNLWNLYNSEKRYNDNLHLCSDWLKINPVDIDFILKRGITYEIMDKDSLANLDYKLVSVYLDKQQIPLMNNMMSKKDIMLVITRAYNEFIVRRRKDEALKLLSKLTSLYPKNDQVKSAYQVIVKSERLNYFRPDRKPLTFH